MFESERGPVIRAALARGLGRQIGEVPQAAMEFYKLVPPGLDPNTEQDCWLAVTLLATYPRRADQTHYRPLPVQCRVHRHNLGRGEVDAFDRRVVAVLQSARGDIRGPLQGLVSYLAAHDLHIDPGALAADLTRWDEPTRAVQQAWARRIWGPPPRGSTAPTDGDNDDEES